MPASAVSYRSVLRTPHLLPAFVAATTVRLSYGTVPLAMLFTAQRDTGSFATAGLVTGAYALTTFTLPVKSRLVDSYGPGRVLVALGLAYPVALLGFLAVAVALPGSVPALVCAAVLAGLVVPPASSAMRSIWSSATEPGAARQRAFSLDAVTEEAAYAVGPALTGALIALRGPHLAVLVTAVAALAGSVALGAGRAARTRRDGAAPGRFRLGAGPLRLAAFRPVLGAALGVGLALSMVEIAVAARAAGSGAAGATGYLMAALSVGSALGGLLWGRRHHTRSPRTHLVGLLVAAALGYAVASLAPTLLVLAAVLLVAGLTLAPTFVVAYLVADRVVPAGQRTEGTTWVNTANNVGVSIGGPLAGVLLDGTSAAVTQALAGVAALVPALLLLALGRRAGTAELAP